MSRRAIRVRVNRDLARKLDHLAIDAEVPTYQVINLLLEAAVKALDAADSPHLVEVFRRGNEAAEDTLNLSLQLDLPLKKGLEHLSLDWNIKGRGRNKVIRLLLFRMVEALWKEREGAEEPWPLFLSIKERGPDIALLQRLLGITDGEGA